MGLPRSYYSQPGPPVLMSWRASASSRKLLEGEAASWPAIAQRLLPTARSLLPSDFHLRFQHKCVRAARRGAARREAPRARGGCCARDPHVQSLRLNRCCFPRAQWPPSWSSCLLWASALPAGPASSPARPSCRCARAPAPSNAWLGAPAPAPPPARARRDRLRLRPPPQAQGRFTRGAANPLAHRAPWRAPATAASGRPSFDFGQLV